MMKKIDFNKLSSKDINSKAWKNAEMEYSFLYSNSMMPFQLRMGPSLTNEDYILSLEGIIGICPAFYPAYFDMGARLLSIDMGKATEILDLGLEISVKICSWNTIDKDLEIIFGNFEKTLHVEFIVRFGLKLIEKFPDKAGLYDNVAVAFDALAESPKAIEYAHKAIELEPKNSHFLNNLGMAYLLGKEFDKAEKYFNLSIAADPKNNHPVNNLKDCKILKKNNLSLREYYLLPIDNEKLEKYGNEEDYEKLEAYVEMMNSKKLFILEETLCAQNQFKAHNYHSLLSTLKGFFIFVKSISDVTFVWEDIGFVYMHFKQIMHKFIFKHGDVDKEIMSEIFESLLLYYKFLSDNKVIIEKEYNQFKKQVTSLKKEMMDKMKKYNSIRHDDEISDKEKEKIREELFEGDHSWMFL